MAWRSLIKVVVAGAEAVGKAFARAVREEIKSKNEFSPEQMNLSIYAGQQAAAARSASQGSSEKETKQSAATNSRHGISVQEAMQVLNLKDPLSSEEVSKSYDHLFSANDKSKGGSFYLQSKVVRAKERIDEELQQKSQDFRESLESDGDRQEKDVR